MAELYAAFLRKVAAVAALLCVTFIGVWILSTQDGSLSEPVITLSTYFSNSTIASPDSNSRLFEAIAKSNNFSQEEVRNLDGVLRNASFQNRTVLIAPLNQAWAANGSMMDYFLDSFQAGEGISYLLDHLVIVALDQVAYERCLAIHRHCFVLRTEGVDFTSEKAFMTEDYLKMTRRKISFLGLVLQMGYSFIFSDGDIMWFRDPFQLFSPDADFEVACDRFNGNETDLYNGPNTGFIHVQSNNRSINLYKYWHMYTEIYTDSHDQDVFNRIKFNEDFQDIGAKIRFLPTAHFGGFCEVSKDLEKVYTMHANCCRGLHAKLADLQLVKQDWKRFKSLSPRERHRHKVHFRAPKKCIHSFGR